MKFFRPFSFILCLFLIITLPSEGARKSSGKRASSSAQQEKTRSQEKETPKEKEAKEQPPAPEEQPEETPVQADTPQWEKNDQENMLRGNLVTGEGLLPDETDQEGTEENVIPLDIPDDQMQETEIPKEIPQELMPLYLPSDKDQFLIDPQKLLSAQERADVEQLLKEIKESTDVTVYLTIFTEDQKIPASLNAPSLARQIFGDRNLCMLMEYRRGQFNATQIVYSEDLSHCLSDNQRKSLLDGTKRAASEKSEDIDILWNLVDAAGSQLPGIINLAKTSPLAPRIAVPKTDLSLKVDPDDAKKNKKKIKLDEVFDTFCQTYGTLLIILFSGTITIWAVFAYLRHKRVYAMESLPVSKQLGALHGTGTTRILYYNTQKEQSKLEKDLLKDFFN